MRKAFLSLYISFISVLVLSMSSGSIFATDGYDSAKNHPSYWGEKCTKVEFADGKKYFSTNDSNITKVVIKGGTTNKVYTEGPFVNLTAEINTKNSKPFDISHVITCTDQTSLQEEDEDDTDDKGEVLGDKDIVIGKGIDTLPNTGTGSTLLKLGGMTFLLSAIRMKSAAEKYQ